MGGIVQATIGQSDVPSGYRDGTGRSRGLEMQGMSMVVLVRIQTNSFSSSARWQIACVGCPGQLYSV